MEFNCNYYNYSMKKIPLPFVKLYKTILIEKVKLLIKRMRWKAQLYDNYIESGSNTSNPLNYIFEKRSCPPLLENFMQFKNDLHGLMKSVIFKKMKNKFLDQKRHI